MKSPAKFIRLGMVKVRFVETDDVEITIPRKVALQFLGILAGCGGIGAVIATAIQGGF